MKTQILIIASLFLLCAMACTSDNKDENNKENKASNLGKEDQLEEQMLAIENNPELVAVNSMAYNNNENSTTEAIAFFDKKENMVKVEEKFSDMKTGNLGSHFFYLNNAKKFATKEIYFNNQLKNPAFIERISFYDNNEKVIFTKERKAPLEEDLENMSFEITKLKDCKMDRAYDIMNQEGDFVTTFQGFVSDGNADYLLVGKNTPDGYATSLAIQRSDEVIKKLSKNERGMIGTPLEVQYEVIIDERGLKFQALRSVQFK